MAARAMTLSAVVMMIRCTDHVSCFGLTTLPASTPPRLPAGGTVAGTVVGSTAPGTVLAGAATGTAETGGAVGGVVAAADPTPSRHPSAVARVPITRSRAARTRDIGAEVRW